MSAAPFITAEDGDLEAAFLDLQAHRPQADPSELWADVFASQG